MLPPDTQPSPDPPEATFGAGRFLERISDAFLALDCDWHIVYLNERAAQTLGRRREDLLGRDLWAEMPEGVGGVFHRAYHRAMVEQTALHLEEYAPTLGRWFENHVYPDAEGLSIFFRDVTERRETQRRLERSEQRYRSLFEHNTDAVFSFDAEGRFLTANPACERVSGYPPEEMLGRPFFEIVTPEFQARAWESFVGALAGNPEDEEVEIRHKTGRRVLVHVTKVPIRVGGEIVGVYGIAKDVTGQRETQRRLAESEQRYRSLAEQNPDAVFTFNPEGCFIAANPACERVSGYTMAELLQIPFLQMIAPEDQARARSAFEAALAGRPQSEEFTFLHKDGRRLTLHVTKMPILVDGAVVGVFGIAKDVTERRRTEEALRESEARMRTVAETSPVAMTITRWDDGRMLFANRHFADLFGVTDDPVGHGADEFYADPADRLDLIGALEGGGLVQNYEIRCLRPDGTPFWTSGSFQRTVYHGEPAVFAAYHDVTERRRLLAEAIEQAERDPLTGLLNHRAFHKRYEEEARRTAAAGSSLAVAVLDLDNFKFFNDSYGHGAGDDVLRQVADALRGACRGGDSLARFGGDEYALLLPDVGAEITADEIAARLTSGMRDVSYRPPGGASPIPVSLSVGVALFPADAPHRSAVLELADERLLRAKTGGLSGGEARLVRDSMKSQDGFPMLDALVNAVDNKDRYTRRHSEDVLVYSVRMARALGMDAAAQRAVEVAALLHDVGKIGVPDSILRKPGPLTPEEFEAVKHHPVMGAVIVGAVPGLEETLDAVRHHHERWDGGGYPDGLAGEAIPPTACLIAVADAYSALTSDRPYRKGKSAAQAQAILAAGAGSQWCPACVAALLGTMR